MRKIVLFKEFIYGKKEKQEQLFNKTDLSLDHRVDDAS